MSAVEKYRKVTFSLCARRLLRDVHCLRSIIFVFFFSKRSCSSIIAPQRKSKCRTLLSTRCAEIRPLPLYVDVSRDFRRRPHHSVVRLGQTDETDDNRKNIRSANSDKIDFFKNAEIRRHRQYRLHPQCNDCDK